MVYKLGTGMVGQGHGFADKNRCLVPQGGLYFPGDSLFYAARWHSIRLGSRLRQQVADCHGLPSAAATRCNASGVQRLGNDPQRGSASPLYLPNDPQHIRCVTIRVASTAALRASARFGTPSDPPEFAVADSYQRLSSRHNQQSRLGSSDQAAGRFEMPRSEHRQSISCCCS
jgi:hypothetical protein